jgi:hypothetical protein
MITKCALCDSEVINVKGTYSFKTKYLGTVEVPNIEFERCSGCKNRILSSEAGQVIHEYVLKEEKARIGRIPVDDFITIAEAIEILGITKQAFSKNPKINRGFIYGVTKGSRTLYSKKSVILFKEKKDGRFKLVNPSIQYWKGLKLAIDNKPKWNVSGFTSDSQSCKQVLSKTSANVRGQENGYASEA